MSAQGAANSRFRSPAAPDEAPAALSGASVLGTATALSRARAALPVIEVALKRLALGERRGGLVSRQVAVAKASAYGRLFRDAWLAWPARVGPLLAAEFDRDATALTVALEGFVREHLEQLASERAEF